MEFLNKLGDTLTGAGKEISSKTKELSETVKLNTQLAKEKAELDNLYKRLGKLYFENCNQYAVGEFRDTCDMIISINANIEKLESSLRTVKGLKTCSNCGKMIPITDKFCCGCGSEVVEEEKAEETVEETVEVVETIQEEEKEKEETVIVVPQVEENIQEVENDGESESKPEETIELKCPVCGSTIDEDDVFCSICGINLKDYKANEKETAEGDLEEKQEELKCQKCGCELDEDDVFCSNCGNKIE